MELKEIIEDAFNEGWEKCKAVQFRGLHSKYDKEYAKEYAERMVKHLEPNLAPVAKTPTKNVCVVCNGKLEAHELDGNCCDTCWLNA